MSIGIDPGAMPTRRVGRGSIRIGGRGRRPMFGLGGRGGGLFRWGGGLPLFPPFQKHKDGWDKNEEGKNKK